ncbi:TldD/PmbA family protein [Leptospira gomenensis]|uniref:TldD/PmbA family protein n=1 Tax=Leptospira gomenensis TaxID=2484974 RepID=A0A5F1YST7_9LEPT|nr:TldD/PmbA family protein [Leptospira gomenensis]TGK35115.1 TldD/PmbA family protein [Leptospira gomenensis]TGK35208.1 TldD/PmbA family protein [Leptospira gomenensis]TGK41069.1 TldD/PmbA family protein [Leptospira gomenensis]TGK61299.1 TldD/PmbA family protein [Leptospira gomenensis]
MNLEQSVEFVLDECKKKGLRHFDLVGAESKEVGIELFKKRVSNTELSNSRGIGIRLIENSRPGYSYSERLSEDALSQMVEDALAQSKVSDVLDVDLPGPAELPNVTIRSYEESLESLGFDWLKSTGEKLDDLAWSAGSQIENVPYSYAGKTWSRFILANSNGLYHTEKSNLVSAGVALVASDGKSKKMGGYSRSGLDLERIQPELIVSTATERSIALLGAEPVVSGSYPIVLSNRISPQIFGMFSSPFSADGVQKGLSRLEGKLGTKIASPILNVFCDPHVSDYPGSRLLDAEGVLTRKKAVIQDGMLQTYLYNLESAKKAGVAPTGNAVRSYGGRVGTSFNNYVVPKGKETLEELLGRYPECIYVLKLEGGSGCSAVSGEISIGVQGFYYKNGKPVHPVDRITMNLNFFDLLLSIEGISNEYNDSYSSVKIPDVLIREANIAG